MFRGSVCPLPRALLVNLKYHPHQTNWFLHELHKASFQNYLNARPFAKCQGFFASLVSVPYIRNTHTIS